MNGTKLRVTPGPHLKSPVETRVVMRDVLIALIPAGACGVYYFGFRALLLIVASMVSAVLTEYVINRARKAENTTGDFSAAITGLLVALILPPGVPVWIPVAASIVAIGLAKAFFGGLGNNIFNPALVGRAIVTAAWPAIVATGYFWPKIASGWVNGFDALTTATPLSLMKMGQISTSAMSSFYKVAFLGNTAGSLGETSALMLLLGGIYLLIRKRINLRIPLSYILTTGLLMMAWGYDPVFQMLSGGLMIGAIFMATDYVTSPITPKGQWIFGFGCGLLTALIRVFGGYPEGVNYSILIMNALVPMIDSLTKQKVFGEGALPNA